MGGSGRPLEGGGRPLDGDGRPLDSGGRPIDIGGRPLDGGGRGPVFGTPETGGAIPPEAGGAWLPPGRACDPMGRLPHGGIG